MQPFDETSAIRRVHREGVLLVGGGRALLLRIAHPGVAAGVAAHSSFREQRWRRLLRTLRSIYALVYGTPAQVEEALASIRRLHAGVTGPGYSAADQALVLWVLATLIDTALVLHEQTMVPLSEPDAAAYYNDMLRLGAYFGLDSDTAPPDLVAFRTYFDATTDALVVSDEGRAICNDLFEAPWYLAPVLALVRFFTAGTLPPRLRHQFGLGWGPRRERLLRLTFALSRMVLPRLPRRLRRTPAFLLPPGYGAR